MKTLVNGIAAAVRRVPWIVVIVVVLISMVLGALAQNFQMEEDSNESFAPDAPELLAVERISDLFGAESSESVMQVIISSDSGDVITGDGFAAVNAVEQTVRSGAFANILNDQPDRPAVLSYIFPVGFAINEGQPPPQTDEELKLVYANALEQMPPEQSGFAAALLPDEVDATSGISDLGLVIIFTSGPESTDEFDQFVDLSVVAAQEIRDTGLPPGVTADPFSFELLFSDTDEFQEEILRMFIAAGFIIITVLAIVFFVPPRRSSRRFLGIGGFAALIAAVSLLVFDVLPALAVVATLLVVFLVWTIFSPNLRRTTADALLTMIVIFFAISWMNGIGSLFFEDQNPMVQIIPILLIGLGVDYSIHLTSRYREEVAWSANVDGSVSKAITTVGVALVLATVTTAAGFLTNVTNDLPALREFGWLASIGIVASFLLMLTFVPAVRELLDRRGMRRETMEPEYLKGTQSRFLPRMAGQTSWLAKKVPAVVLVVAITLGGLGVYGWSQLEAKFSFLDFIPTTSPLRGTFETLLDRFGGGFGESTQVLIEGDVATAESWNAMIDANQATTQVDNVVLFGGQPAARSPMAIIGPLLIQDSPTFNPEVAQAAQTVGMDQSFKVTGNVDPLYDAAFAVVPEELRTVISVSETGYNAALFDITTQGGETGAAQLSDDLNVAFAGVAVAGNDVVVTSDEIISDVIITTLRDSQTQSLILTLLVALLVLVANFWFEARRPVLGVITALPVVLVVLLTFSFMTVFGIPYGPVTATIAALGIGIGIPYMIHITHRFLEDRIRCDTGEEAVESTLGFTGGALAGSALTTIAGFGILVTSTTIPFQQFGLVTAVTIGFALLTAILILPSLLTLWDRYHRRRGDIPVEADVVERALQTGGAD